MGFDFEILHSAGSSIELLINSQISHERSYHTMLEDDILILLVTCPNKQALTSLYIDAADGSHTEINSKFRDLLPTLLYFIETQRKDNYCNLLSQSCRQYYT